MFGERRSLILPILFDIANLVKTASTSAATGKSLQFSDIERIPTAEFLKRSYIPLEQVNEDARTTVLPLQQINASIPEIEPLINDSNIRDDRLQIDDDENITRNIADNAAINHSTSKKTREAEHARAMSAKRPLDDRSYHERKLNMTNFNGTNDQFAMESEGVPIQVVLPRMFIVNPNMTLEEYEELAFKELNDTDTVPLIRNETTGELLPMPEMLISRFRNKNPYRKLLPGTNSIESFKTCERFDTLCLRVEDYPM